ncbi:MULTISPECIES: ferredoxin [unclassified Streptosporangium]|uniref:ferredoxin n=1 Tax=Streptosporangium sp. NPDC005286 TaxID=3154463 RepID=UPI0033AA4539
MKVVVDLTKCVGLGVCESLVPEMFEVNARGELVLLREDVSDDECRAVEEAVSGCPTMAQPGIRGLRNIGTRSCAKRLSW